MIYHKLEMKMTDLTKLMRDSLHNLEVAVAKKLIESKRRKTRQAKVRESQSIASLEEEIFKVKEENVGLCLQLDQAKRSLLSEIHSKQEKQA